ncbi:23-dihydroxybiphenyl-12-dioxygenase [Fusarium albosuccineum]|uniref:23-dihydroxybiphenyl-12-dioxygenase n=1 Tax=Fusarium albosuccineum TaxID=1237068 RepID=A0A8H4LAW9_9HYPO|nr:23-dihydroxybiphenyl-12-dioxygenase [Fusarium albosuccineum]
MERSETRRIKLVRIAHVYYTHRNISAARSFLADFGFEIAHQSQNETYYRGTGAEPFVYCASEGTEDSFGGAAFVVESMDDLNYAAQSLPHATEVHEMKDVPEGGFQVTFKDPIDGFPFHLVYGQTPIDGLEKDLSERDFNFAYEFYTSRFNFTASDLIYNDDGKNITTFLHLDRDKELVDHHCFFFFEGPVSHVHHSSFETHDFDTQLLGHDWLREKGYENCWGVGRHIMGSQIFDYWFDPSRFILEHYVDGDLVNEEHATNRSKASPNNLHVWGNGALRLEATSC